MLLYWKHNHTISHSAYRIEAKFIGSWKLLSIGIEKGIEQGIEERNCGVIFIIDENWSWVEKKKEIENMK